MRVLVLGSGGREHALAWKLSQSPLADELYCAPGNPGTALLANNLPVQLDRPASVVELALEKKIDLVVVGPEAPLVAGVADALREAKVATFGPSARAAAIEGSKSFAKEIMSAAKVPTASFRVFEDPQKAKAYARATGALVVKADGLASGKGVIVARTGEEASRAVEELSELGGVGGKLLLEEFLEGEEVSVIALCDGERFVLLPPAQDHKRIGEGDTGPNTGGMGAYAPAPFLGADGLRRVGEEVIAPTLVELRRRGTPFRGALYAGLMLTARGPRVLEFNCRLGDPEAQVLALQLQEDLLPLLDACARGQLEPRELALHPGASVGVVLAAAGYPGQATLGARIEGIEEPNEPAIVFHGGTRRVGADLVVAGGRVLTVCARGASLGEARKTAYAAVAKVRFDGMQYRRDIGVRGLQGAP